MLNYYFINNKTCTKLMPIKVKKVKIKKSKEGKQESCIVNVLINSSFEKILNFSNKLFNIKSQLIILLFCNYNSQECDIIDCYS